MATFIDGFMKYTEGRGSPQLYRKWTAIFLVSAVMERKSYVVTTKGRLFPNQYILLVGPAGVGKSLCTTLANELIEEIRTPENPLHLAPTSVTKASLIDRLAEAERRIIKPTETPSVTAFNSLIIIPNEFGVFLPSWEGEFMNTLTDLWDCGRYAESRRTGNTKIELPNTQLNLLSATTPAQLMTLLPEGAWEQGFMSRMMMAYSGEITHTDLFAELDYDGVLYKNLVAELKRIYKIWGEMTVSDEAKEAINTWARGGGQPAPDHPKLTSYRIRRIAHLLKLCMVACASESNDRIITLDHYVEALDWLVELEAFMPDIFKSMKTGGDARTIEECYHFTLQQYMRHKEPVPEHLIITFLQERAPAHSVDRILDVMERARLLEKKFAKSGGHAYVPKTKAA